MTDPIRMVTDRKSDEERAAELKDLIAEKLAPVLTLMDEARKEGFTLSWSINLGYNNKSIIQSLRVSKEY